MTKSPEKATTQKRVRNPTMITVPMTAKSPSARCPKRTGILKERKRERAAKSLTIRAKSPTMVKSPKTAKNLKTKRKPRTRKSLKMIKSLKTVRGPLVTSRTKVVGMPLSATSPHKPKTQSGS